MLHLGGGKYRAKVMDISGIVRDDGEEEGGKIGEEEEVDDGEGEGGEVRAGGDGKSRRKSEGENGSEIQEEEEEEEEDGNSSSSSSSDEEEEEEVDDKEEDDDDGTKEGAGKRETMVEGDGRVAKKPRTEPPPAAGGRRAPHTHKVEQEMEENIQNGMNTKSKRKTKTKTKTKIKILMETPAPAPAPNDGGETMVTVSEYREHPRNVSKPPWEGRVGREFPKTLQSILCAFNPELCTLKPRSHIPNPVN
jgi:hypothetical protein